MKRANNEPENVRFIWAICEYAENEEVGQPNCDCLLPDEIFELCKKINGSSHPELFIDITHDNIFCWLYGAIYCQIKNPENMRHC